MNCHRLVCLALLVAALLALPVGADAASTGWWREHCDDTTDDDNDDDGRGCGCRERSKSGEY